MDFLIGVDIGTTSTKVVLFDQTGRAQKSANNGYPLIQTEPEMAEEDPKAILQAVVTGIQTVLQGIDWHTQHLLGISFSAAMHSLMLLDQHQQPLTNLITWADNRAKAASASLKADGTGAQYYQRTGTPIHPMTPLSKLLWLKTTKPELIHQASYFIGIKDYVLLQLYGELVADYSLANATGLFNLYTMDWDTEILQRLQIQRNQLPTLVDTNYQLRQLQTKYANLFKLPLVTPGIVGASDGALANLGVAAADGKTLAFTMGTSGAVRVINTKPVLDPAGRLFCYYLAPDHWVIGGPVNNGGIVLKWARDTLFATDAQEAVQMHLNSLEVLTQRACEAPAGAHGLLFLPYLGGERAPLWDANARGSFIGLSRQHQQADILRAVMEGILFNLTNVQQLLTNLTGPTTSIHAAGGFARSAAWCQMLADIANQPVTIPTTVESSCLGAAMLGLQALGKFANFSDSQQLVHPGHTYRPNPAAVKVYQKLFPLYQKYDHLLANQYTELANFQDQ